VVPSALGFLEIVDELAPWTFSEAAGGERATHVDPKNVSAYTMLTKDRSKAERPAVHRRMSVRFFREEPLDGVRERI
jgi:hypothetical protein